MRRIAAFGSSGGHSTLSAWTAEGDDSRRASGRDAHARAARPLAATSTRRDAGVSIGRMTGDGDGELRSPQRDSCRLGRRHVAVERRPARPGPAVRVLLTDGSGLTARQVATQLSSAGHWVEALSSDPLALTRFTRHVHRLHRVPRFGEDPFGWLDVALTVAHTRHVDVLLPTQEQVAVLSAAAESIHARGVATAVPEFGSLRRVQEKVSAYFTLRESGLPQPRTDIVDHGALSAWNDFPVYLKTPIGTASAGVVFVEGPGQLERFLALGTTDGSIGDDPVVVQAPVRGPLVMVQAIFCRGVLVASHANLRIHEGASGGASHKRSVDLPIVRDHLERLGEHLRWNGALSLDAILDETGPVYIDVNPRLVEPGNAWRSGVDLVSPLLDISLGRGVAVQPPGRAGVATHQLLLAVLGAAQRDGTRRPVVSELRAALAHAGQYADSTEELTPLRRDLRAAIPVITAATVSLGRPSASRRLSSGAVTNYSLTRQAWQTIVDHYRGREEVADHR